MKRRRLLYYITDRLAFPGDLPARRKRLLEKIDEAALAGVDYIQLREKDLSTRELESLARDAVSILNRVRTEDCKLKAALLINSRADVALAVGAEGVHLRSDDISASIVRDVWRKCGAGAPRQNSPPVPLIGVSCHSSEEVARAGASGATFAVFAPVFEKKDAPDTKPAGLSDLNEACKANIPVFALGGITLENARSCLDAGASGIAGIRLFQDNEVENVVDTLRNL